MQVVVGVGLTVTGESHGASILRSLVMAMTPEPGTEPRASAPSSWRQAALFPLAEGGR